MITVTRFSLICAILIAFPSCNRQVSPNNSKGQPPVSASALTFETKSASVENALKILQLNYLSERWESPMSSDQKAWFWGDCSVEDFLTMMKSLNLHPNTNVIARWPGAIDGPAKRNDWFLQAFPETHTYFAEDVSANTMIFAAYHQQKFYIKIASN